MGALALLACGGEEETTGNITPDAPPQVTGSYSHFVNSSLKIGMNAVEANALAFADLDGKGDTTDNALGVLLANLNGQLMLDNALATAVTEGSIVILHSIRADDLANDTSATWQVWLGDPQTMPKFDGTGTFTVATNAPRDAILSGKITAGKFEGQAAQISLELSLMQGTDPLRIKVNAAHIEADVTANGLTNGRLAGAITTTELNDNVVPAIAELLDARIGADAGCRTNENDCEAGNKIIRMFFDIDPKDGTISVGEIRDSTILSALFDPDVDVLLANGQPGQDDTPESVSISLGFGGAKGIFTAPTE